MITPSLAAMLRPTAPEVTVEMLTAREKAVQSLVETIRPLDQLVLAAHDAASDDVNAAIGRAIGENDPTFVPGDSRFLESIMACAAVLEVLEQENEGPAEASLLMSSANFIGLRPSVNELSEIAAGNLSQLAKRARRRIESRSATALLRRVDALEPEDSVVPQIKAVARRFEEIVKELELRLSHMDEEIDALWWARRTHSRVAQKRWVELPELDRIVAAALEVDSLLSVRPASVGVMEIMRETAGVSSTPLPTRPKVRLFEAASAFARLDGNLTDTGASRLLPLNSIRSAIRKYDADEDTVRRVMAAEVDLDIETEVSLPDVGEQLLTESALLSLQS